MNESALAERLVRLAYLGQQESWRGSCAFVAKAIRRVVLGKEAMPGNEALVTLEQRYRALLERDLANARQGLYPTALLFQIPYRAYARVAPRLAADIPHVVRRMKRNDFRDLPPVVTATDYPAYYRRTFHWQSDGYLSQRSAELYDLGVELLFGGTADVMRRQVIPPIVAAVGPGAAILDVGCGTGRALSQLAKALPSGVYDAIDLSPWYLRQAARELGDTVRFTAGNAEAMPYEDGAFDAALSVFLFHELPRAARRNVWREMFRVVRPGGTVVIMDSIQESDAPAMSVFVQRFNAEMHEPFFRDYQRDDLASGLAEVGFDVREVSGQFLSKLVVARRPAVH